MNLVYEVTKNTKYKKVREVLVVEFSMSSRLICLLKKLKKITLNGMPTYLDHILNLGDVIKCDLDYEEPESSVVPTSMPLDILYEDDAFLVINKPYGIPVHPSMEHYTNSLANGVRAYFDKIGLNKKIRPVNRLDKDTSGIVIFAKNSYIQECLVRQMKTKEFVKKYIAIVDGKVMPKTGTIDAPIARKENSIIERCVSSAGDRAITHYRVLTSNDIELLKFENSNNHIQICDGIDVVECTLETGRTHQIRVHFASINHPILGDTLYGSASNLIDRQSLHAYLVEFVHPIFMKQVQYIAPVPINMSKRKKK